MSPQKKMYDLTVAVNKLSRLFTDYVQQEMVKSGQMDFHPTTAFVLMPLLEKEGKNPFELDSKEPDWSRFQDFLNSEVRYTSLKKAFPKEATELFAAAEENAKWRYNGYKRLALMDYSQGTK